MSIVGFVARGNYGYPRLDDFEEFGAEILASMMTCLKNLSMGVSVLQCSRNSFSAFSFMSPHDSILALPYSSKTPTEFPLMGFTVASEIHKFRFALATKIYWAQESDSKRVLFAYDERFCVLSYSKTSKINFVLQRPFLRL